MSSLREIQLNHNDIHDEGACAIADALFRHPTVSVLEIFQNKIGLLVGGVSTFHSVQEKMGLMPLAECSQQIISWNG